MRRHYCVLVKNIIINVNSTTKDIVSWSFVMLFYDAEERSLNVADRTSGWHER